MNRSDLRKALDHQNVRAFLKAIRLGEGTSDEAGYWRIVGGRMFHDDRAHPNTRIWIERYKVWSTAAGAYQIIGPTWRALVKQYGFEDYSPDSQDEAAVALIAGRKALADVKEGRFEEAIRKCALEWASLPGSNAGQRTEDIESVRQVYIQNGGVFA